MSTEDQDDAPNYEVGQEQLDAVDRMLEELDLDDGFDRAPSAFRIFERFEQQQQHQQYQNGRRSFSTTEQEEDSTNGHALVDQQDAGYDIELGANHSFDQDEVDEGEAAEPVGYIPLDQGEDSDDDSENHNGGDENGVYMEMQSDDENDSDKDDGQGYDDYLRAPTRHGDAPVPVIPQAVQIELEGDDPAAEKIPDEDLKTIAMVMSSISLPAPDWARSIPEERWLPRILQAAEATSSVSSVSSSGSGSLDAADPSSS
ncbi:hypothetical protein B0O80DRAFT_429952 [Mortierella sp. GBAus27b]|nr:hypothetical protein BGX31_006310 [Mortierella sp. GBA43]KAI8347974.1 hypothetical protein B0O80DRAFT_429952 [Mortierella sp. GBAus27b]